VKYSKQIWDQLKNITADNLIKTLEKDNWKKDVSSGAELIYRKSDGKVGFFQQLGKISLITTLFL